MKNAGFLFSTCMCIFFGVDSASAQVVCGPGNPLGNICEAQAEISASITVLQSDLGDLQTSIVGTSTDLSALDARVTQVQSSVAAVGASVDGVSSSVDDLSDAVARLESNLDAQRAAAHKFWTSPTWSVLEGNATIQVTALNLGTSEVEVVFTFFDRDGRINREFSTARLLPAGASITFQLDDRGVDPPQFGWFAVTASGPVQVDGYASFGRGEPALAREASRRTLLYYPVDCQRDPSTWPATRAPFLCDFIERELTRLW